MKKILLTNADAVCFQLYVRPGCRRRPSGKPEVSLIYGAVWYMRKLPRNYNLKIEEKNLPKGIDIIPAIIADEIDVAASAVDGAIAARANGVPVYIVAGFAKGGARIVGRPDMKWKSVADLKGKEGRGGPRRCPGACASGGTGQAQTDLTPTSSAGTCSLFTWPMPT